MKASDLEYGRVSSIGLILSGAFATQLLIGMEVSLTFDSATLDASLIVDGTVYPVGGATDSDKAILRLIGTRNLPKVCWIVARWPKVGPAEGGTIQVREFPRAMSWSEVMEIAVDDMVVDDVRKKRRKLLTPEEVVEWLSDRIILEGDGLNKRLLLSGGTTVDSSATAFRLHGRGYAIDVKVDAEQKLRITRVVEAKRPRNIDEQRPIALVESSVRFVDATVAGEFRGTAKTLLDELVRTSTSYLGLWKEYNALEWDSTKRRARSFGWLYYSARVLQPDGRWRFTLEPDDRLNRTLDRLIEAEDVQLEAATKLPKELEDSLDPENQIERKAQSRAFSGAFVGADRRQRTVDILPPTEFEDVPPPPKGVLFLSLTGDRKRLERRELAQARIASATCPMPQLGLLIEGQPIPERRMRRIDPGDAKYRGLIRDAIGGEPTARQLEALRTALNTPDLALIQGPPGTGKTRVIAALQSILAELDDGRTNVAGKILLTSYQHDAVENAASRTSVFGLPAMKIGKRRDQGEALDGFHRWRLDQIEAARADLVGATQPPLAITLKRVQSIAAGYLFAPMPNEQVSAMLRTVYELVAPHLDPVLQDRLLRCRQRIERPVRDFSTSANDDRELALQAVRGIRTDEDSFADDGAYNCHKALIRLESTGVLEPIEAELLRKAADWESDSPIGFLPSLTDLKGALSDRLAPPSELASLPKIDAEVEQLLSETIDALFQRVRNSPAGVHEVLWEYLDTLENDIYGVRATVKGYTVVLAATCQQAASKQMSDMKVSGTALRQLNELDSHMVFHDIIVDEAARANPLDLFVPMALAERRIVLVGDHRQLPHILEPDVEREIERSIREETRDLLKKSLFERLFTELRRREEHDGIKRTITLNKQFRMHPALGKFVSETFYRPYGEEFESPRAAEPFEHNLDRYVSRVAAWINVPGAEGYEAGGHSKRRRVEARRVAEEASRILSQRPDLSVGVITFYAAQRDELMGVLVEMGIAERTESGGFEIREAYRETSGTRKERLRVGTVDAFQGKEFDIVLLSMTRSNDIQGTDERSFRRKYGHLMLENRLCVAMSRQQRLLIVVGDASMLRGATAADAIPGLVRFYELCGGPNGIRF